MVSTRPLQLRKKNEVPDLLADRPGRTFDALGPFPACEEELAEEGIEWLFDAVFLVAAGVLLLFKGGEKPFQHQQGATLRVRFDGGSNEDGGMFGPVGRELDSGLGGEDEGWRGDVGKVAADGGDGLLSGKE